jgi:hypothetical protein
MVLYLIDVQLSIGTYVDRHRANIIQVKFMCGRNWLLRLLHVG